jgi:hypothetical protein
MTIPDRDERFGDSRQVDEAYGDEACVAKEGDRRPPLQQGR